MLDYSCLMFDPYVIWSSFLFELALLLINAHHGTQLSILPCNVAYRARAMSEQQTTETSD